MEVVTDREDFRAVAAGADGPVRIPIEVHISVADPFNAYRRARSTTGGAYLATTGGQAGWGYFGVDPVKYCTVDEGNSLGTLAQLIEDDTLERGDCSVPYPCGVIGWLSYDIARELETIPSLTRDDRNLPTLQVAVYETLASWEEPRGDREDTLLHITSCPRLEEPTDKATVDAAYNRGRDQAREFARQVREGDPSVAEPSATASSATFESDCGQRAFAERVRRVKSRIREGDTFQANISHRLRADAAVHPITAFDALREVNPAPYSALLELPGIDLVSASPELLVERTGARVLTEPIAGTRPRGNTEAEDEQLEADLRSDEKERAEHAMLVDLERNDLGKICEYGSVDVTEYRRVDRYSAVMHLVSLVEGKLRPRVGIESLLAAVFPGGTITGAPKPRTMEIIEEVEDTRRGPYTGSIGIFGFDERATVNIIIRTLVRHGDEYHLRVGAGIVHDSVPEREYTETLDKARALVTAVDRALGTRAELHVQQPGQQ